MGVIRSIPQLALRAEPDTTLVAFGAADPARFDVYAVADELWRRGWYVDRQGPPPSLHCTVNAVHDGLIPAFAADLRAAVEQVEAAAATGEVGAHGRRTAPVSALPSRLDGDQVGSEPTPGRGPAGFVQTGVTQSIHSSLGLAGLTLTFSRWPGWHLARCNCITISWRVTGIGTPLGIITISSSWTTGL